MKTICPVLLGLLLLAAPAAVQAQFAYMTNNGAITLTEYTGAGGAVVISNFVTSIGTEAFGTCTSLTSIYFNGNAPAQGDLVFYYDNYRTVYFLPGATGFFPGDTGLTNPFPGASQVPWFLPNPTILNSGVSVGAQGNAIGFTISWATNISVVVEACTNLGNAVWTPLQTNALTNGSVYFSDPQWTNFPSRYYRIRSP
jgi:hypothetical protein